MRKVLIKRTTEFWLFGVSGKGQSPEAHRTGTARLVARICLPISLFMALIPHLFVAFHRLPPRPSIRSEYALARWRCSPEIASGSNRPILG